MPSTQTPVIASPLCSVWPSNPNKYFVNSVAASYDGQSFIAGTFFKTYSTADLDNRRIEYPVLNSVPVTDSASQTGTFGTYAFDPSGNLLWSDTFQGWQGIFWVDSASAASVCAAGGWYSQNPYQGIIKAYNSKTGAVLLEAFTAARVNQVSLSSDGTLLLTAADALCLFQNTGSGFVPLGSPQLELSGDSVVTAFIAGSGNIAVCATLNRGIFVFVIQSTGLVQIANWPWPSASGCCHSVVVTPDGTAFAAGGSGGLYALFNVDTLLSEGTPVLSCKAPNNAVIYSVAIPDSGDGIVAVANVASGSSKGCVYFNSLSDSSLNWSFPTLNCPNRVVLNSQSALVAVADGYPDGCPGTFYLLNASNGQELWQFTSGNMAWGVSISADGSLVVGGSDDSNAYAFAP